MDLANLCFIPADKSILTIEARRVAKDTAICPKTGKLISTPPAHILDMKIVATVDDKTYTTELKNVLYRDANRMLTELIKASFINAVELEKGGNR